jgi:hypothetical protein
MSTQVAAAWETTELIVMPYKDVKDLYILGDVSELIAALDESLVTVNTVLGSRYVGGIRDFVETWRKNLILFQDTLDEWLACQRVRSRRPAVLRCLHAIDATRGHRTIPGVVSGPNLRSFRPSRVTESRLGPNRLL